MGLVFGVGTCRRGRVLMPAGHHTADGGQGRSRPEDCFRLCWLVSCRSQTSVTHNYYCVGTTRLVLLCKPRTKIIPFAKLTHCSYCYSDKFVLGLNRPVSQLMKKTSKPITTFLFALVIHACVDLDGGAGLTKL